jgi:hypothetical protein
MHVDDWRCCIYAQDDDLLEAAHKFEDDYCSSAQARVYDTRATPVNFAIGTHLHSFAFRILSFILSVLVYLSASSSIPTATPKSVTCPFATVT